MNTPHTASSAQLHSTRPRPRSGWRAGAVALSLFLASARLYAGEGIDLAMPPGPDPTIADTAYAGSANVLQGQHFSIDINLYNDEVISGGNLGFTWGTTDLNCDSVTFTGSRVASAELKQVAIDNVNSRLLPGFVYITATPLQPGSGLFCKIWFTVSPVALDQYVTLDSTFVPPAGPFILVAKIGTINFTPQLQKGTIKIGNPILPPTIQVAPDSFFFSAVEGGVNPAFQVMNVSNIGLGTLNWTATKSQPWLIINPPGGVAPSITQVRANSIGLLAGHYYDTIVVADPLATNNPQRVPVHLHVILPPPIISVSQVLYNFNAIANGPNPASQGLTVQNVGGGTLNWTESHLAPWLTVTPGFGANLTLVNLSVNITGLPLGLYIDTIAVSDPAALNSPTKVIVKLSVASDLPLIDPDPDTLVIILDEDDMLANSLPAENIIIGTKYFHINNGGPGSMTFSVSETSTLIFDLAPTSGVAGDSVGVTYKLSGLVEGDYYADITITSPEAANSPYNFVVRFHVTPEPATLELTIDTVKFSLFECEQQFGFILPTTLVGVSTNGESVLYDLFFGPVWVKTQDSSGAFPDNIVISPIITGLSQGVYLDSIKIFAPNAQNNPLYLFVQLTVSPPNQAPFILTNGTNFILTARENDNFVYFPQASMSVSNARGGCINWSIIESIPWLIPQPGAGTNPGSSTLRTDGTGFVFGEYNAQYEVAVAGAQNSPLPINVKLRVWRLWGDADYSNFVDISDVVYLITYIFLSGPDPEPEIAAADSDCNGIITIADPVYLIDYIFNFGDTPCGNPEETPPNAPAPQIRRVVNPPVRLYGTY